MHVLMQEMSSNLGFLWPLSKSEKSLFKHGREVFSEFLVVAVLPKRHQEMEALGQEEEVAMVWIIHLQ
jgi:hypothetical protein